MAANNLEELTILDISNLPKFDASTNIKSFKREFITELDNRFVAKNKRMKILFSCISSEVKDVISSATRKFTDVETTLDFLIEKFKCRMSDIKKLPSLLEAKPVESEHIRTFARRLKFYVEDTFDQDDYNIVQSGHARHDNSFINKELLFKYSQRKL